MAEERIRYEFEGDVNPLKKATEEVLALLGQFEGAFRSAAAAGNMQSNVTAQKEFQRAVNATIESARRLSETQINMQVPPGVASQYGALGQSIRDVSDILMLLGSSTRTNSTDLQIYSDALRSFRSSLDAVRSQLTAYNTQFNDTSQATSQATPPTIEVGDAAESMGREFQNAAGNVAEAAETISDAGQASAQTSGSMNNFSRILSELGTRTLNSDSGLQGIIRTILNFSGSSEGATGVLGGLASALSGLGRQGAAAGAGATTAASGASALGVALPPQIAIAILAASVLKKLAEAILGVVKAFAKLAIGTGVTIVSSLGKAYLEMVKFSLGIQDADDSTKSLIGTLAKFAAGLQLGKALGEAIKGQIDFIENTNLFVVAMGKSIDAGNKFVASLAELYGLDPSNIVRATGLFNQLTSAMEAPAEAAEKMSLGFTKAAIDLSSLFNVPFEQATQDLTAGLQGMSRSVRKYGLDIRISTLQQKAFSLGLQGQVKDMAESTRQGLRFLVMMEQLKGVHGDFARTLESPANQLRVLKEQFGQLARTIGSLFVPALKIVLPVINGLVMALRMLIETFKAFFGIKDEVFEAPSDDSFGDAAGGIGGVGDAASSAAKKIKNLLAPWDELNVLSAETAGAGGGGIGGGLEGMEMDPKILEQIKKFELGLENIRMKALDLRDAFLKIFGLEWVAHVDVDTGEIIQKLEAIPGGFADRVAEKFREGDWTGIGEEIGTLMGQGITVAADFVSWDNLGATITKGMNVITGLINGWATTFPWDEVGRLLGNSVNTIFNTANLWFTGLDIGKITAGFATTINNAAKTVDWSLVGQTLANGINFAFTGLVNFLGTIGWTELALDLTTMLNNAVRTINWANIGASFNLFFNGALDFLTTSIETFDWIALGNGLGTAFAAVDWLGILKKIANLIFGSLKDALEGLIKGGWESVTSETVRSVTGTVLGIKEEFYSGLAKVLNPLYLIPAINDPISSALAKLKDIFGNTGTTASSEFIHKVSNPNGTPIKNAMETSVVMPVNTSLNAISTHSATVGTESATNFQNGVGTLPGWYKTNVADKIKTSTGAISTDFGTTGVNATTNFKNGVVGLPASFSNDVTNPMTVSLTDLTNSATIEATNIDTAFRNTLTPLPVWVAGNVTTPITTSFKLMSTNINTYLSKIIAQLHAAISAAKTLASLSGGSGSSQGSFVSSPPSKKMATGGVISRRVTVGEGLYDEAIVPLGDSPQMDQLLQKFADIAGGGGGHNGNSDSPITVQVIIGDKEWDSFVYQSSERGKRITGAQPITVGG